MKVEEVKERFRSSARLLEEVADRYGEALVEIGGALARSLGEGGTLYLFGNGGSAADSQHIAAELVGRFGFDRPALSAIALTTDTSKLTAIGNDYGYEAIFARQLEGCVGPGDAVIGISTSGRSPNVVRGLEVAGGRGALTIAMTGQDAADCARVARHLLAVPDSRTPRIQEAHIAIGHLLCEFIEESLFGSFAEENPADRS
jgi:D-sedoheptulose 7-phosphate isomerase